MKKRTKLRRGKFETLLYGQEQECVGVGSFTFGKRVVTGKNLGGKGVLGSREWGGKKLAPKFGWMLGKSGSKGGVMAEHITSRKRVRR